MFYLKFLGFILFFVVSPIFSLLTIILAVLQRKNKIVYLSLVSISLYISWMLIIIGCFMVLSILNISIVPSWAGFPLLGIWSLLAVIPHILVFRNGRQLNNNKIKQIGIYGICSITSVTTGLMLICYSAVL